MQSEGKNANNVNELLQYLQLQVNNKKKQYEIVAEALAWGKDIASPSFNPSDPVDKAVMYRAKRLCDYVMNINSTPFKNDDIDDIIYSN
jgi:hypothetical protein